MPDRRHFSIAAVIAVATVVFIARPSAEGSHRTAEEFGAIPEVVADAWRQLTSGQADGATFVGLSRLATALWVHADFQHLLYNMVFLWAFGTLIARHLGPSAVLILFVVCGVCGNVAQVLLNVESEIPIVGASGAICGFEGLYLGLALRWDLPDPDVWPLAHPIPPLQLGAFAVVGFLIDAYSLMNHDQRIAFGAHMGGFVSGFALAAVITTIYPTLKLWQCKPVKRQR